jgi:hypothetical protein
MTHSHPAMMRFLARQFRGLANVADTVTMERLFFLDWNLPGLRSRRFFGGV